MEELNFNRLDEAFDKCCVKAAQKFAAMKPYAAELVVFAQHHPKRPVVIENLKRELQRHYQKRKSYRDHNRFKQNAQLIILTVAEMYMHAIKRKRDEDNMSESERIRLAQGNQLKNDVAQLIREVPRNGQTKERN